MAAVMTAPPPFVLPPLGTILITGGCGFLGSHIVSILMSKFPPGTSVHVLDLRPPRVAARNVTYHTGDISNADSVRGTFEAIRPTVVIHTASPVFQSSGGQKAKDFMWKINVDGTKTLLEEAKRVGVKAFVYTSSASVVSDTRTDLVNADERWELVRGDIQPEYYSDTKAEAEALALAASSRALPTPFLTTAIRPSAMFGEQDVQMIPNMLQVARDGRTGFQLGKNENLFDFTYVGNTAQAHLLAAARLVELHARLLKGEQPSEEDEDEDETRVDGEAFVITNASPVYFWDFARAIWAEYYKLSPSSSPKPPVAPQKVWTLPKELALFISTVGLYVTHLLGMGPPRLVPSAVRYSCMTRYFRTRKAEAALGYVPEFALDEGVERTVKWFVDREREQASAGQQEQEAKKER